MPFLDDAADLALTITNLEIELRTADAPHAGTDSKVYCNVVFKEGSLLFEPLNHRIDSPHNDFERGDVRRYPLPLPSSFTRTIGDIDAFHVRKGGGDGWLLGGALLFANGLGTPVMGNNQINEFLDNEPETLFRTDWSTKPLCGPSELPAQYPLLCPTYRLAGPVLGQLSDTSANILYRVEQEGTYRLKVFAAVSGALAFDEDASLSPTATFKVRGLTANTHYRFSFFRVFDGQDIAMPEGDGEFRTFPKEGSGVRFRFAFGSCSRNRVEVAQTAWTGIKAQAADPAQEPASSAASVRFFLHLGDTFYFYDDVTGEEPKNLDAIRAAHLSARRHPRFLDMARVVPCCAVWDDHDFRINNEDSEGFTAKPKALTGFLDYWGNDPLPGASFGLTTRITYGNVDIYLMDGRFLRIKDEGQLFSTAQVRHILELIAERPQGRLVILASGSLWNHTRPSEDDEGYGDSKYKNERERFYTGLNGMVGTSIQGLVFLSGDVHQNEIYEVSLVPGSSTSKVAPEFVSSPLGHNHKLKDAQKVEDERKWSAASAGKNGRKGFATLEVNTTHPVPHEHWSIVVRFYDSNASEAGPYKTQRYVLNNGEFRLMD
jgi:hypothetical protein